MPLCDEYKKCEKNKKLVKSEVLIQIGDFKSEWIEKVR